MIRGSCLFRGGQMRPPIIIPSLRRLFTVLLYCLVRQRPNGLYTILCSSCLGVVGDVDKGELRYLLTGENDVLCFKCEEVGKSNDWWEGLVRWDVDGSLLRIGDTWFVFDRAAWLVSEPGDGVRWLNRVVPACPPLSSSTYLNIPLGWVGGGEGVRGE